MRILHITTNDRDGAGMCCLRIHQSLLDAGIESKVVTTHNTQHVFEEYEFGYLKNFAARSISKLFRLVGLNVTERNKILALMKKYHAAYSLPVSSIDITNCKWVEWADIIHLHWVNNYLDYPSFFKKVKKPIVWTLHDENLFYGIAHHHKSILADHPMEFKYQKLKLDAVRSAENLSIVFLSDMMSRNFTHKKIIERCKKTVINNSVNTEVFRPYDRQTMRRKYELDEKKRIFVLISMNIADPNKGLDVLTKVLMSVDRDSLILAIGGNPQKREWKNVRSVGIIKSQRKMCELISCADYMAMPSYQEGFSQSPMEAMACGLPVVAFPVSGTSELINERNGIVCNDFSSEALKKGIELLMSREYDPLEIRNDMIKRFSPKAIAKKYKELYNSILSK